MQLRATVAIVAVLSAASCGGADCLALPCPFQFAISLTAHSASAAAPISGLSVSVAGSTTSTCSRTSDSTCALGGGPGHYELDISATGFQTVHRTVDVTGIDSGCNSCGSVDTQHLDVTLIPVSRVSE